MSWEYLQTFNRQQTTRSGRTKSRHTKIICLVRESNAQQAVLLSVLSHSTNRAFGIHFVPERCSHTLTCSIDLQTEQLFLIRAISQPRETFVAVP